jgi:hypothetical protein
MYPFKDRVFGLKNFKFKYEKSKYSESQVLEF